MQGDLSLWFSVPWWLVILSIFSRAYWWYICLLWKNIYLGPSVHFVIKLFVWCCYKSSLYILDINSLSSKLFSNIFSSSVGCLFILLSFLHYARTFQFDVVPLVYFCFCFLYWGDISKKKKNSRLMSESLCACTCVKSPQSCLSLWDIMD